MVKVVPKHWRHLTLAVVVSCASAAAFASQAPAAAASTTSSTSTTSTTSTTTTTTPSAGSNARATARLTWSELSPATSPPALSGAAAAYDADNSTVVVFGGTLADGSLSSETWVFNGTTWQGIPSAPPARTGATMAFDPTLHQLILFGGLGAGGKYLADTWAWNGASWFEQTPATSPSPREGAAMSYDSSGNLVLFGGTGAPASAASLRSSTGVASHTRAASSAAGASPAVSTNSSKSTRSTNSTNSLSAAAATTTTTTPTYGVSTTGVLGDTWTWNGSDWVADSPSTSPPARTAAAMTWDPATRRSVLFGGSSAAVGANHSGAALSGTWTWDGHTWSDAAPSASPPARFDAAMGYDAALGKVMVFSGSAGTGILDDTWAWDGSAWAQTDPGSPPPGRASAAAAYDDTSRQWVVYGGNGTAGVLSDTAILTAAAPVTITPNPVSTTSAPARTTGHTTSTSSSPGTGSTGGSSGGKATTSATTQTASTTALSSPATTASGGTRSSSGGRTTSSESSSTTGRRAPLLANVTTLHRGSLVTLEGTGFRPGATVVISFHSRPYTVGKTTADRFGDFSATVAVPTGAALGNHHFVATGFDRFGKMTTLATAVKVVGLPPSTHGHPAVTATMVFVAVALPVLTWFALAVPERKRKQASASH